MSEETKPQASQQSAATADPAKAAKKKISIGDKVHLVHAKRGHVEAEVTKVHKGDAVDLETVEPDPLTKDPVTGRATPVVITNSPLDPTGTKHDSWHPIEE